MSEDKFEDTLEEYLVKSKNEIREDKLEEYLVKYSKNEISEDKLEEYLVKCSKNEIPEEELAALLKSISKNKIGEDDVEAILKWMAIAKVKMKSYKLCLDELKGYIVADQDVALGECMAALLCYRIFNIEDVKKMIKLNDECFLSLDYSEDVKVCINALLNAHYYIVIFTGTLSAIHEG